MPGLLRFTEYDVAVLFLPEELHPLARSFFEWAVREKEGPGYFCPCLDLDPLWTAEQIREALAKHAEEAHRLKAG